MKISVNTESATRLSGSQHGKKEGGDSGPGLIEISRPARDYGHIKVHPSPTNVEGHKRGQG